MKDIPPPDTPPSWKFLDFIDDLLKDRKQLATFKDVKSFWLFAIAERNAKPTSGRPIARMTHAFYPAHLPRREDYDRVHGEIGALEAPGWPHEGDKRSLKEYEDDLWARLEGMVKKLKDS
jgi:hypothetical protein